MKAITIFALGLALSGCAQIQTYEHLEQPVNTTQSTHVGGAVFKLDREKDLPNIFGKADLYGRKVDAGHLEVRYLGMLKDERLAFRIVEVDTRSNETTMSRTGVGFANTQAQVQETPGGAYGQASTVYTVPPEGETVYMPPEVTQFVLDPRERRELTIEGVRFTILAADPYTLEYQLERVGENP